MGVTSFLVVVTLLVGSCSALVPGWCVQAGDVQCNVNCTGIEICIPADELGTFDHEPVETCQEGASCWNSGSGVECSANMTSCPPRRPYECTSLGGFPDPYDCRVAHFCIDPDDLVGIENRCGKGMAYNALSKACDVKLSTYPRQCTVSPVPACNAIGQSGALCEDPSLYYTCFREYDVFFPKVYQCSNGFVFNEVLFDCVDPAFNGTMTNGPSFRAANVVNGCQYPDIGPQF